jgi:hypothetical protein
MPRIKKFTDIGWNILHLTVNFGLEKIKELHRAVLIFDRSLFGGMTIKKTL